MSFFLPRLGIDLGTNEVVVYQPQKGIVLREPTVAAISLTDKKIISFGEEAKEMLGKMPDSIQSVKPIKNGAINDYKISVKFISYILNKVLGKFSFFKPEIIIAVPSSITGTEKRAVIEAFLEAGAKEVFIVKEPVLAAIGSGVPIHEPIGRMVVKVGGGTTDIAVISLGGVVFSKSIKVAGNKFDESIIQMVKDKYKCVVGERTAEMIKVAIGSTMNTKDEKAVKVRGRDFETGQPLEITVNRSDVVEALKVDMESIISCAKEVFSETPPELASDIMDNGVLLCGSSAYLGNISEYLEKVLHIPSTIAEEPKLCVALGLGAILDNMENYKRALIAKNN